MFLIPTDSLSFSEFVLVPGGGLKEGKAREIPTPIEQTDHLETRQGFQTSEDPESLGETVKTDCSAPPQSYSVQ